jgi:hypothetical protein
MKLYTLIFSILTLLFVGLRTNAQDSGNYKNAVMFEIGGNGLAYSVNYERFLRKNFNARAGFSLFNIIESQTDKSMIIMSYPISCNYLINIGRQKHFIETGIGLMNLITSGDLVDYKGVTNYYLNPFLNFGYRYEPTKNRLLYRVGLSPFLGTKSLTNPTEQGFQPLGSIVQIWGYMGIGYKF